MAIEAIDGNIEFAIDKPSDPGLGKIPFQHFVPFLIPGKCLCLFGPEFIRRCDTPLILTVVFLQGFDL
jgi:hypothetical protein